MTPKVSIGVPVFNGGATLKGALESLLGQTFGNFDLLISDNASTDDSFEIANSFAALDNRVKCIRCSKNIGPIANFESVFKGTEGEFFMWSACDDLRDPRWLERAVDILSRRNDAVLVASDIAMCHDINRFGFPDCRLSYHDLDSGIDDPRPHIRYRAIVRGGGWSATYGLIRRRYLAQTRSLAAMTELPSLGIAADYLLMELCLLGRFARVAEPMLINQVRERTQAELANYMSPSSAGQLEIRSSLLWQFRDMLALGARYNIPLRDRLAVQLEYLRCLRPPGTLHTHMLNRNVEATLTATGAAARCKLALERALFLRPGGWNLLMENRRLSADLRMCRASLVDRTQRLEKHIADYGPEIG